MPKYSAMTSFTTNVKAAMKLKGITQRALADACGMNEGNMSRLLAARHSPTLDVLERIAAALDVDLYELFLPNRTPEKVA